MSTIGDLNEVTTSTTLDITVYGKGNEKELLAELRRRTSAIKSALLEELKACGTKSVSAETVLGKTSDQLFKGLKDWIRAHENEW